MQFDYFTYKKEDFTCLHCGWKGKGSELSKGDFHESSFIMDLDCPKCYEHMGFWQSPEDSAMKAWQKKHPEWEDD